MRDLYREWVDRIIDAPTQETQDAAVVTSVLALTHLDGPCSPANPRAAEGLWRVTSAARARQIERWDNTHARLALPGVA